MMKKEMMWKVMLSGALALTVAVTGITMYSMGDKNQEEEKPIQQDGGSNALVDMQELGFHYEDLPKDEIADVSENSAVAEQVEDLSKPEEPVEEVPEKLEDASNEVLPALDFSDDSVILWPVSGAVLIDYSMDTTTYFPTLDLYKCNNGLVLGAVEGDGVSMVANGKVLQIAEHEETGTTVTLDLGNGYQAVYGQLKDVTASAGDVLAEGDLLGYVAAPTKYFVEEGANLYFAMKKDGTYMDPMIYLETIVE